MNFLHGILPSEHEKWPLWVGVGVTALTSALVLRRYFQGGVCHSTTSLFSKTAIVTGANVGLGYETAKDFAKRGARVILACRNLDLGKEAVDKIIKETNNRNVLVMSLDLSSLASVRSFSSAFLESEERLDILVNNAGVMACPKATTADGFEYQLGVNHLGHFLLTKLLLEKIKECSPSRIVNVSSKAAIRQYAKIHFDDIHLDREYTPWKAYGQSKLANVLFTLELAKRLKGTGVITNCCHPGVVMTNLGRHMSFPLWKKILFAPLVLMMFKTSYYGAQTQIYLSVAPEVQDVSGFYFADCRAVKNLPEKCFDKEAALKLWNVSEELVVNKVK